MGFRLAVAGKGGTGKTTLAALMIKHLTDKQELTLAVDADPNSTLHEKLGVSEPKTVGQLREVMLKKSEEIPAGMSKQEYVEYQIRQALIEEENYDLITMGRSEGPGCYCYINNVLRTFVDTLSDRYDYVVTDNEAGMEHLSRRTARGIDALVVVSDPTGTGLRTAARIRALADEMEIKIGKAILVVNRVPEGLNPPVEDYMEGFDASVKIPDDMDISEYALKDRSLLELPTDNASSKAAAEVLKEVFG